MPLVENDIQAACLTEGELAKEISTRYARYYKNLQVDVFIKEYHSKQVAVIGAVNEQSRFELQRRVRLLELLTYAKGPSAKAGQTINIVHGQALSICRASFGVTDGSVVMMASGPLKPGAKPLVMRSNARRVV